MSVATPSRVVWVRKPIFGIFDAGCASVDAQIAATEKRQTAATSSRPRRRVLWPSAIAESVKPHRRPVNSGPSTVSCSGAAQRRLIQHALDERQREVDDEGDRRGVH